MTKTRPLVVNPDAERKDRALGYARNLVTQVESGEVLEFCCVGVKANNELYTCWTESGRDMVGALYLLLHQVAEDWGDV